MHSHLVTNNTAKPMFYGFAERNALLLNAAGEGIYGVDTKGRATFVNPAAEKILGWQAQDLIGKNIHLAIHHSHNDGSGYCAEDCPIFAAFRDGTVRRIANEVFWNKAGLAVPVEYTSTPVYEDEMLVGAVVIFRDVSERVVAENNLQKTMGELRQALKHVEQLQQRLELENEYLKEEISEGFPLNNILGQSAAVRKINYQINLVAPTTATVLITGESGTGKELIARAIYRLSERHYRPLIRVNCAAVPAELFESEFFGHIRGAFSGAVNARLGRFEVADGGTLFLDEIGELPLSLQGKLLRVLQDGEFERIGESTTRKVDVRVIAATNKNLKALVEKGLFREDLYFRLEVFPIHSAPLRERVEDIPVLAAHFLKLTCKRFNKNQIKISLAQIANLQRYPWPGNIRELENYIERQVIFSRGDKLILTELENKPLITQGTPISLPCASEADVKSLQIQLTLAALRQCNGKIYGEDGAAHLLGIKPTTLASRLKKWKLDKSKL